METIRFTYRKEFHDLPSDSVTIVYRSRYQRRTAKLDFPEGPFRQLIREGMHVETVFSHVDVSVFPIVALQTFSNRPGHMPRRLLVFCNSGSMVPSPLGEG